MMYGSAATPPPPRLGFDRAVCLPQDGPYHTLLRPRIVSLSDALSARYLGTEYGTVRRATEAIAAEAAAQVQRRFGAVFPALVAASTSVIRGLYRLALQHTWTPSSSNSTGRSASSCLGNLGRWGCSKYCLRRRCSLASRPRPHPLTLRAKK
jgi:hypothetical protein